jgi:hypothetical protein
VRGTANNFLVKKAIQREISSPMMQPNHFHAALVLCIAMLTSSCKQKTAPSSAAKPTDPAPSTPTPIAVVVSMQGMTRGGKPYFVQGVGGDKNLKALADRGGNSIRTWTTNGLEAILDEAEKLNLTVSAGIWLENECSWFSYKNPEHCKKQADRVRKEVTLYRNYPALLAWGLGNEAEGDGSNDAYWQQLERLALMVKEIDPLHPTFTAVAGLNPAKTKGLMKFTPSLDYVGVNTYGGVFGLRKHLENVGWNRPWLLTEWGPRGFWESKKTPYGAPIEQTSTEKAEMMLRAYREVIRPDGGCLGNYAFVWAWKFEATATWFGLYTHEGETTASVDALEEIWQGRKASNRAPSISPIKGMPSSSLTPQQNWQPIVEANDPDSDALQWQWAVLPELQGHQHNGRKIPPAVANSIVNADTARPEVKAPDKPGIYRLYVWVKDGKGHAATANAPFEVR